ncbi:dihydropteroate synthase [Alienimonas californiensis]|uniref:Dihydropteroate synthase n=1 Tax=Alienimonas californiensis TaxID=2527989 RepID=A0A517PCI6_9PLAN|nr:dihydropteroate synthase [Alienimonas californiensis]QDT17066.1 Dihydropteroate synthase [Alienimonas californiensis]
MSSPLPPSAVRWSFRDASGAAATFGPAPVPRLMGIVNVTPDSFSDGGRWATVDAAVEHALALADAGAAMLDVGGESTRPGAEPVGEEEERRRVVPVITALAERTAVPISIDTTKAAVAAAALDAGAGVVNDVSGLTHDPAMTPLCAQRGCGVVAMHMIGTPRTMQLNPRYDDVLAEVSAHLAMRLDELEEAGVKREAVLTDPGIGFGKTAAHNLALLRGVPTLKRLGRPVLIGHSRKGFLKALLGREVEERTAGTIGVSVALAGLGTDWLRVHDVAAVRDALAAWNAIAGAPRKL